MRRKLPIVCFTGISSGISADAAIAATNCSSFCSGVGTEVGTGHAVGGGLGGSAIWGSDGGVVDGDCMCVGTCGVGCIITELMWLSRLFGTHPHMPICTRRGMFV